MTIRELMKRIHQDNCERGWWDGVALLLGHDRKSVSVIVEKLCLIHSEISEALEEIRNGHHPKDVYFEPATPSKPLGFPTELADAMIRIFDLAEACGINLEAEIKEKVAYNRTRGFRHGGKKL